MRSAKVRSAALPFCWASRLDWISNIPPIAASLTKSGVEGLAPNSSLTPVFSVSDSAKAGTPSDKLATTATPTKNSCLIAAPWGCDGEVEFVKNSTVPRRVRRPRKRMSIRRARRRIDERTCCTERATIDLGLFRLGERPGRTSPRFRLGADDRKTRTPRLNRRVDVYARE